MERAVFAAGAVSCLLSFFLVGCLGHMRSHRDMFKSIECYVCNSEYDPRCADPFDDYTIAYINCSWRNTPEHLQIKNYRPVLCRKTIQKVQDRIRVIRGCGYVTNERFDEKCVYRTGTHEVSMTYCSCSSSRCNGASALAPPFSALLAGMAALVGLLYVCT